MRKKRRKPSKKIHDAIEASAEPGAKVSPYDSVKDLIGCVSGGPPGLSEGTGKGFAELLAARRRRGNRR